MKTYNCESFDFEIIMSKENGKPFPYLRNPNGNLKMYGVSPVHCRSFVMEKCNNGLWIVSKGNGLCYSNASFLYTPEFGNDTWGLLLKQDAVRDFIVGNEIADLGIRTNKMQYVLELDCPIKLQNGTELKPVLLQYSVECPYRTCDAPFMTHKQIMEEVDKWDSFNKEGYEQKHMIAADVLIHNLRILHDHNILHNAIHNQNYTWALELLDFELSHTPNYPYSKEDYRRHVPSLMPREVIQTYEVINYIAGVLHENIDYKSVDYIFKECGFDINSMAPCLS